MKDDFEPEAPERPWDTPWWRAHQPKSDPFAQHGGTCPQDDENCAAAFRDAEATGVDPRLHLTWGPVPLQRNVLFAMHPAVSFWCYGEWLVFVEAVLRKSSRAEIWYVTTTCGWHLLLTEWHEEVPTRSFYRCVLGDDQKFVMHCEGIS